MTRALAGRQITVKSLIGLYKPSVISGYHSHLNAEKWEKTLRGALRMQRAYVASESASIAVGDDIVFATQQTGMQRLEMWEAAIDGDKRLKFDLGHYLKGIQKELQDPRSVALVLPSGYPSEPVFSDLYSYVEYVALGARTAPSVDTRRALIDTIRELMNGRVYDPRQA